MKKAALNEVLVRRSVGAASNTKAVQPGEAAAPKPTKKTSYKEGRRTLTLWIDEDLYLKLNEAARRERAPVVKLASEAFETLLVGRGYNKLPRT